MTDSVQHRRKVDRSRVYLRICLVASALAILGVLFWPLELNVYYEQGGSNTWLWNEEPAVSTETANFWRYYSFRPVLYASALAAVVSFVLYRRERAKCARIVSQ